MDHQISVLQDLIKTQTFPFFHILDLIIFLLCQLLT